MWTQICLICELGSEISHQDVRVGWKPGVFISCGCYNTLPQTWWLKTTEIYSHTVLEAKSPKKGVSRAMLTLKALGKNPSLPLPASGSFQQS